MQNSWNLHGEDSFVFEIIEETRKEITQKELQDIEQGYLNIHYGKEECYNLSNSAHGPDSEQNKTSVLQKDKNGNLIRRWEGISEASEFLGINAMCIVNCCRGRLGSIGGYSWEYADPNLSAQFKTHSTWKRKIFSFKVSGE